MCVYVYWIIKQKIYINSINILHIHKYIGIYYKNISIIYNYYDSTDLNQYKRL